MPVVMLFCLPVASVGPVLGHLLYGSYCICIISITAYINSITAVSPTGTEGSAIMNVCCFGRSGVLNLRDVGI